MINQPINQTLNSFKRALEAPKFSKITNIEWKDESVSFQFRDQVIKIDTLKGLKKTDIFVIGEKHRGWFSAPNNDYDPEYAAKIILKTIKKIFKI